MRINDGKKREYHLLTILKQVYADFYQSQIAHAR